MGQDDFELLRDLYDAALAYLDSEIGRLYSFLSDRRLLQDTVVVLTSDHGDNIGDHGLMDHAYSLHDTLLRVPLVITYPDGPAGLRVSEQVQLVDIFPTVAHLAGCNDPAGWDRLQGRDIHPSQGPLPCDRAAFSECLAPHPPIASLRKRVRAVKHDLSVYDHSLEAVRTMSHKLIWASDGRHELYDLERDPMERRNLAHEEPALVEDLRAKLDGWRAQSPLPEDVPAVEHSAEVARRLEDLGYIG
jgi:arylsulfatase A-like enzyme